MQNQQHETCRNELCAAGRFEVLTVVYKETAVLGDVMSVTLVKWTAFQQNHDENRSSRSSKMLVNFLPVIWCHTPEDSTHKRVTIRTLPSWCSSYIPKGLVQVEFSARWNSVHIWSAIYEGVSKSARTMLITRKSLVVHEFPARVCCGGVLWVSVPSGMVGCGSVWLLHMSMCVLHQPSAIFWYQRYGGSWRTKGVHQVLCEIG